MPFLHAQLSTPLTADRITDWDGAATPEARAATLDLFNAIGRGDVVAVQQALARGARPNARRTPPTLLGRQEANHLGGMLDAALWLLTHNGQDSPRPVPHRTSQPIPDLVATLITAGASTYNLPSVFFKSSDWETHPACKALENLFLDLLVSGQRHPIMTREARETQPLLFRSVVVATPVRNPHSWLHRAIVRERWDAVKTWVDQGLVLNFPGSESACELLVMGWMDEPGPQAMRTLLNGFDLLRPALLSETEEAYRTEVVATVRALAFFQGSPLPDDRRERLVQRLGDLLAERPTNLTLTPEEAPGAAVDDDGAEMRRIMQGFEAQALRTTLSSVPSGASPPEPAPRSRL